MEVFVPNGTIFMRDSNKKKDEGQLFPIENISFCNAESIANGKIFSWISKEENDIVLPSPFGISPV
jgi:hypothetical protein